MEEQDNKDKLLKGAEDLFMRYGVRSITMDDIARHLGISKKTIYQHFADKDDVVVSVAKSRLEKQRQQFDKVTAESKNSVEEMVKLSYCIKENMRDTNPSVLFDMQKYHQRAWNVWLEFKHKFIRQSIMQSLKRGMEEGYFRSDINTDILVTMRLEVVQMAFDNLIFPREQFNLTEVQSHLFDHFVYGILTEKGKKLYQKYKETNAVELSNP
jgi:TetR/AcrR family transcriptional regulator, cholesterol catabolism regulator